MVVQCKETNFSLMTKDQSRELTTKCLKSEGGMKSLLWWAWGPWKVDMIPDPEEMRVIQEFEWATASSSTNNDYRHHEEAQSLQFQYA